MRSIICILLAIATLFFGLTAGKALRSKDDDRHHRRHHHDHDRDHFDHNDGSGQDGGYGQDRSNIYNY